MTSLVLTDSSQLTSESEHLVLAVYHLLVIQGFLLSKKQREAAAAANGATITSQAFRSCLKISYSNNFVNKHTSKTWIRVSFRARKVLSQVSSGLTSGHPHPHPYRLQPIIATGHYESEDFPLRKTASEPNLLKVRLKQRVIERRSSPLARRKDRLLAGAKRKSQLANATGSNPDSGPNSPPSSTNTRASPTGGRNTPIQEPTYNSPMASLVLTDSFQKLPDQITYPTTKPYDLQNHVFSSCHF
uniref:histone deacetylase n=1 Tax=Timema douglasi TaxID=61478 RepID=A0A7R8VNX0_TIMDO|nr:unnamed protein product [Timema douglasi]